MAEVKHPHTQHELGQKANDVARCNGVKGGARLLRRPEVEARTGLSRSTIYEWMKRGYFPQPVKLGERLVAWCESDVTAWLESRETRVA